MRRFTSVLARELAVATRALRPHPPVPAVRPVDSSSDRPSILGTTIGVTLGSATLMMVAWPIADIFLPPLFIKEALVQATPAAQPRATADEIQDPRLCHG